MKKVLALALLIPCAALAQTKTGIEFYTQGGELIGNILGTDCTVTVSMATGTSASGTIVCNTLNGVAPGTFFSQNFATPPVIGGTTPNAGNFSTLSATGNLTTNVTGSTQCLQANSAGVISGTGATCTSGGTSAFSGITSGTNTSATMTVGSGATITPSGSGVNNANQVNGAAPATSCGIAATNSSGQVTCATTSSLLTGTTGTISGSVANGACDTGTVTLTGVTSSYMIKANATSTSGPGAGWHVDEWVSATNTVTVQVCNATGSTGSPTSTTYNVVAIP